VEQDISETASPPDQGASIGTMRTARPPGSIWTVRRNAGARP
jgi:hypothetical protein